MHAATRNGRNRVRRETGKEQMVRVHYDEGAAIHIGPESCAGGREAVREALTGECAGQPLSRESTLFPGADVVPLTEGNTDGRDIASAARSTRVRVIVPARSFQRPPSAGARAAHSADSRKGSSSPSSLAPILL